MSDQALVSSHSTANSVPPENEEKGLTSSSSTSIPITAARPHLAFLDGLRACAALFVLLHHIWLQVWTAQPKHHPTGWLMWLTGWLLYGHFAVDLFIVISGFCLMLPVVRENGVLKGGHNLFFRKRMRRILPPYYASILFAIVLIRFCIGKHTGSMYDGSADYDLGNLSAVLLLVQDIFSETAGGKINPAFWSIAVEWHIYFLFPLLVYCYRKYGMVRTLFSATASAYILNMILDQTYSRGMTLQYIALFVMGMLAVKIAYAPETYWVSLRDAFPWKEGCVFVGACIAVFCFQNGWTRVTHVFDYVDFWVGFCCVCVLVLASRPAPNRLARFLEQRWLVFIGGFAYSLYLIHQPLLQVLWEHLLMPLHVNHVVTFILLLLISVPVILGISYLFYLCFERPFLNQKPVHKTQPVLPLPNLSKVG